MDAPNQEDKALKPLEEKVTVEEYLLRRSWIWRTVYCLIIWYRYSFGLFFLPYSLSIILCPIRVGNENIFSGSRRLYSYLISRSRLSRFLSLSQRLFCVSFEVTRLDVVLRAFIGSVLGRQFDVNRAL